MDAAGLLLMTLLALSADKTPESGSYELPAIAGMWQIELDDVDKHICQERYNFGRFGKLLTSSAGEITKGNYHYTDTDENKLPILAMQTTYDNNAPDCQGNQIDQAGETSLFFVKLDNVHYPTKMQWCTDVDGKECSINLWRVLP